jgi:hypothetical protein
LAPNLAPHQFAASSRTTRRTVKRGGQTVNVDLILDTFKRFQVSYLLIGGMNFLLRHEPVLTYDVDIWIDDTPENRRRCESSLVALDAEWGRTDDDWRPVSQHAVGWLDRQGLYCLSSPYGAIDVFRQVAGLEDWQAAKESAVHEKTAGGIDYLGLSDEDMLKCQYALDAGLRRRSRIETLERALRERPTGSE